MLHRALDDSYPADVREHITVLTLARTAANACFRFGPAFLATIASGQHVTLDRIGIAVAASELAGLLSPLLGGVAERLHRRTAMWGGLFGVAVGTALAAASPNLVLFAIALILVGQCKLLFDLGLAAWVSDRVPFERRGRVIGLTETSWALGMLVGVSLLGLVTAATDWRVGYAAGGAVVLAFALVVSRTIGDDPPGATHHERRTTVTTRMTGRGRVLALGTFCLMAASQSLFVTFSGWLKDSFGFSDAGISAVVFFLGFGELFASLSSARFADHWGKARAAGFGGALMVPAAGLLAVTHTHVAVGLPLMIVAIVGFEFAIVSIIPIATDSYPGLPAKGLAVNFGAGTVGRAVMSVIATRLYVAHGMGWPATVSAVMATLMVLAMVQVGRLSREPA